MQIYGYHRTSTKEQHLDRGIQEIERYCNCLLYTSDAADD